MPRKILKSFLYFAFSKKDERINSPQLCIRYIILSKGSSRKNWLSTTSLNESVTQQPSKHSYLYMYTNDHVSDGQRSFFLQWAMTKAETHYFSNWRVTIECSDLKRLSISTLKITEKWGRKNSRARGWKLMLFCGHERLYKHECTANVNYCQWFAWT